MLEETSTMDWPAWTSIIIRPLVFKRMPQCLINKRSIARHRTWRKCISCSAACSLAGRLQHLFEWPNFELIFLTAAAHQNSILNMKMILWPLEMFGIERWVVIPKETNSMSESIIHSLVIKLKKPNCVVFEPKTLPRVFTKVFRIQEKRGEGLIPLIVI